MITDLSADQLRRLAGIKRKIETLQNRLTHILGIDGGAAAPRQRRRMSAAGRARIAAVQRARWAKIKGKSLAPTRKRRYRMSAAGRARIAAAARARWKKAKAVGRNRL
jgi:hypothetical protein